MTEWLEPIRLLFQQGGSVLWAIFAASALMWLFIIERYTFYFFLLPSLRRELYQQWQSTQSGKEIVDKHLFESVLKEYAVALKEYLKPIRSLSDILLLLGLFGTISGMITVFDAMSLLGTNNARGMAMGISLALITTMAGLVTALSGLYFAHNLESLAERKQQQFVHLLRFGGDGLGKNGFTRKTVQEHKQPPNNLMAKEV